MLTAPAAHKVTSLVALTSIVVVRSVAAVISTLLSKAMAPVTSTLAAVDSIWRSPTANSFTVTAPTAVTLALPAAETGPVMSTVDVVDSTDTFCPAVTAAA